MKQAFDYIGSFYDDLARVRKYDKWGFINTKGKQVIECKIYDIEDFKDGFAKVKKRQ